ncbi:MAG: DNA replication/repair protein RecF [Flavobacteriaceae bacterium]|nr:DNA replication/repair protein RecF [Flavobacteriaceae bacterium]
MHLKQIILLNYKNFSEAQFNFESTINCFVGKNGVGKTNVLDAIYHLAYGKSYFNPQSVQNIKHGEDYFVIEGLFEKSGRSENIICSMKKGQKKILKRNGKIYDKFSEHVGFIPLVIISPHDRDLIIEGSETRRKFLDNVISQSDPTYLTQIINYQKILSQRNALLKYFALNHVFDYDTLSIYDEQMSDLGYAIFEKRKQFIDAFTPIFIKHHQTITNGLDNVQLRYESQLFDKPLSELLQNNLQKDRTLQYSNYGIHKDDLAFEIDEYAIKKFGSQGQQKSYLIALKLAQFEFLKEQSKQKPILLFDDIFDKLDENRVSKIIGMVHNELFGQIFISDTHPERTEEIIKSTHQKFKIFNL